MVDANALQYAPPDPKRDAADRLSRLHGALELKATLLALLLPPHSLSAGRAFELETGDIRQADGLRLHVENLEPGARLPWFELLLARMASHPLALRQELLQSTRRVMGARGVARAIDRLHWLTMRRGLGEALTAVVREAGAFGVSEWLDSDLLAIATYCAFLARMVPVDSSARNATTELGAQWYDTVMAPWEGGIMLPGCEAPSGEAAIGALNTLQTLPLVERPALVCAWAAAAVKHSPQMRLTDSAADALRLTCGLLDTPMPPEVAAHFIVIETK